MWRIRRPPPFIVQDELVGALEDIGPELSVPPTRRIWFGAGRCPAGYASYEDLIAAARDGEPDVSVAPEDPWMLMYTSGTTGNPKGAIRNHRGGAMLSLVTEIELGMHRNDGALLVMPMCHANSLYFFSAFAYCGATTTVYNRKSFDPEHCARVLGEGVATFTSLVPTHYAMMLALPGATRAQLKLDRVAKLMISSAPARPDAKRAIMEMFPNAGLFELYGSTETGWATMLHPDEQFDKLGSVGRECVGSAPIKLLDSERRGGSGRRGRRALRQQSLHLRRLLEAAGKDTRGVPRRLLHGRRHGAARLRRLHPSRRPQEQHDHHRRRERLSVRRRGCDQRPSVGARRGGDRLARRQMGRTGSCGHRPARGRLAGRGEPA